MRKAAMAGFAIVALAAILGVASAQPTTKATRFDGFTYVSNVIGYVNMTMDFCDMKAAIAGGNYSAALNIYQNGKNSRRGLGLRTFYLFASYDAGVEPLYQMFTMGRDAMWLDKAIKDAFAARNGPLALGLMQVGAMKYMLHEIDEGATKITNFMANTTQTSLVDDDAGAPHNVDEGYALWAGGSPMACDTLSSYARGLGELMDTTFLGTTPINMAMTLAWNDLLAYSRNARLNAVEYNATRTHVVRLLTLMGLQGVSVGAFELELAGNCRRPDSDMMEARAKVNTHWAHLKPMLASRMDAARYGPLERALSKGTVRYAEVREALKDVVSGLGRRMAEIGEPNLEVQC